MGTALERAGAFMATHGRLLDRRRFRHLVGDGDGGATLAALEAYRNPGGGYGWGLEPDLRSPESQTAAALHAFEAMADAAPATTPRAAQLCDWLQSVTLPDGGVPFALPVTDPAGCAPFWVDADHTVSSLQISAIVAENAHRVAAHDPAVASHPWLHRITDYCLAAAASLTERPHALILAYAIRALDAIHDLRPNAAGAQLRRLGEHIPATGTLHVGGGLEHEMMRPLDFAPFPDRPARALLAPGTVAADLQRLASLQQDDGGWPIDFATRSPQAALEWRGYATVRAVTILLRNGAMPPPR